MQGKHQEKKKKVFSLAAYFKTFKTLKEYLDIFTHLLSCRKLDEKKVYEGFHVGLFLGRVFLHFSCCMD